MMRVLFIYRGPHLVHAEFAKSVGAHFLCFRPPLLYPPTLLRALRSILKGYEVIFCEESTSLPLAVISKKIFGSKIILWGGDSFYFGLSPFKQAIIRGIKKWVDGFLAPSKYIARIAKEFFSCPIEIVYDPVLRIEQFLSRKGDLTSKNICFVGTYSPRKGLERLVAAFQIVRKRYPKAKLYLIGEIPDRFSGPGIVLTGRVPAPEMYMEKCSIYVHPAIYEPFGLPVVEAILTGLVPVATKSTGAAEFLDRELIVDGSPESLSDKIIELFERGPAGLKRISLRLKKRILRKGFGLEKRCEEFRKKFWKLISTK